MTFLKRVNISRFRSFSSLRVILIVLGLFTVILSFLADNLGYGDKGSFGTGQIILLVFGCLILMGGLFAKNFIRFYKDVALVLLNVLILMAGIELVAIATGRLFQKKRVNDIQNLPYYSTQSWTESHWVDEMSALRFKYRPFVVWGHIPFSTETINVNAQGFRITPDSENIPCTFRIFMFGGSTMFGYGSPDWGTIPAYLQQSFNELPNNSLCVENYGQDGYVLTQSLILLMCHLQNGDIPDAVIFYFGVNGIIAAMETAQSGMHVTYDKIAARYEEKENLLLHWYMKSRQYTLLVKLVNSLRPKNPESGPVLDKYNPDISYIDSLAESMAEKYLVNLRIVKALADEYLFKYFFFLQPNIIVGEKGLTIEEQNIKTKISPVMVELTKSFYSKIEKESLTRNNLYCLENVFNEETSQIWIDDASHVTPVGNQLIAQSIFETIKDRLR